METTTRSHHPARLRLFELNLRTRELYCNGARLNLHGHPIDVLAMLVEQPGELVTRQAIQNKLWPSGAFVDSEHMLNNSIARLRDALGDHAAQPRYIETLPRLGYRFMARVDAATTNIRLFVPADHLQHAADNAPANPSLRDPPAPQLPHQAHRISKRPAKFSRLFKLHVVRRQWMPLALSGMIVALLVAFGFVIVKNRPIDKSRVSRIPSLSVLPLVNLSGDPLKQELVDSMTDSLIIELSKIDSLKIVPGSSVMKHQGARKSLPRAVLELKVDYVIEGSVLLDGARSVMNVELIEVPSGTALWVQRYECDVSESLALGSNIAHDIAVKIQTISRP